ncbi:MAG: hypothetical protein HY826_01140 [Actinobacteria bacterium]|nr:hypothetical protein [Actinomycetota bacterium]
MTAAFSFPYGVAIDANNNLYVSDSGTSRIRKITPAGVVTTLAGGGAGAGSADGAAGVAQFNLPTGLAVDGAGNVYVADLNNDRIRKVTPAGVVSTLAGSTGGFTDGTGAAAQFNDPYGVAVDGAGNILVADTLNRVIRKVTAAGVVTTFAGATNGFVDGVGTAARFGFVNGIAIDSAGTIYVADGNNALRRIK